MNDKAEQETDSTEPHSVSASNSTALLSAICDAQKKMNDDERVEFWAEITDGYCVYCGGIYLPCYCTNDQ